MNRQRFGCERGKRLPAYHIVKPRDTSGLCGLGDIEILNQQVTESTLAENEWRMCPVCLEQYRR